VNPPFGLPQLAGGDAPGGNFGTSVLAYDFSVQSFRSFDSGLGAALAVLLFLLVTPIVIYNIRQMRKLEAR
jgi:alpha-glucoside transport system permease protein